MGVSVHHARCATEDASIPRSSKEVLLQFLERHPALKKTLKEGLSSELQDACLMLLSHRQE